MFWHGNSRPGIFYAISVTPPELMSPKLAEFTGESMSDDGYGVAAASAETPGGAGDGEAAPDR